MIAQIVLGKIGKFHRLKCCGNRQKIPTPDPWRKLRPHFGQSFLSRNLWPEMVSRHPPVKSFSSTKRAKGVKYCGHCRVILLKITEQFILFALGQNRMQFLEVEWDLSSLFVFMFCRKHLMVIISRSSLWSASQELLWSRDFRNQNQG